MEAGDFAEDELQDHSVGTSAGASAGAASSSGTDKVYQRGPTRLPTKRPSCEAEKPVIRPTAKMGWVLVAPRCFTMQPKAVLGVLLKDHFPGMVLVKGKEEPEVARTWAHYVAQPNFQDRENVVYANKPKRVKGEFGRFFKLAEGYDDATIERHFEASVKKALSEMFYHARVYAVRKYYAEVKKQRLEKARCIVTHLEHEQYMQVPPHWCISHLNAWKALVDSWCSPEYVETHGLLRERRLANPSGMHHQGSVNLRGYIKNYAKAHPDKERLTSFTAVDCALRGKANTVSEYSANAPPKAYATPADHAKVTGYAEVFEELHGPGADPSQHDLDVEVVVRAGGGMKHGRLVFRNGTIDPSTIPSLPHRKVTSTSSSASIRSRPGARQFSQQEVESMVAAQVQAQMEAQRQAQDAQIHQAQVAAQVQAQMAQMKAALRAQYDHFRPYLAATSQEPPTAPPPFDLVFVNLQIEHAPQPSPQTPVSSLQTFQSPFMTFLAFVEGWGQCLIICATTSIRTTTQMSCRDIFIEAMYSLSLPRDNFETEFHVEAVYEALWTMS
ncbi:hypothetical protein BRADI_1g47417v3 [Brachypodium distachyon]|uniref:Uncharacterized protein n=1 Tax=Brachypodium distachyon TaxID=15368 RepID=A0A2K2DQ13_BRADI|nr:hypothetical protein BRADI_1g47417v3 [Brachypodium distachyon]